MLNKCLKKIDLERYKMLFLCCLQPVLCWLHHASRLRSVFQVEPSSSAILVKWQMTGPNLALLNQKEKTVIYILTSYHKQFSRILLIWRVITSVTKSLLKKEEEEWMNENEWMIEPKMSLFLQVEQFKKHSFSQRWFLSPSSHSPAIGVDLTLEHGGCWARGRDSSHQAATGLSSFSSGN